MSVKIFTVSLGIILGVTIVSYFYATKFLTAYKKAEIRIGEEKFSVDVAETIGARARGLSGREKLNKDEGMFFIFGTPGNYGFWMKDMKFPIDIIWIKDNKIVGFEENAQPKSYPKVFYPPELVNRVLEINAGVIQKAGFKIGDEIRYNQPNGKNSD